MNQAQNTAQKIKNLKIQGAKAIAMAFLFTLKKEVSFFYGSKRDFLKTVKRDAELMATSRPTEPLVFNCFKRIKNGLAENQNKDLSGLKNVIDKDIDFLVKTIEAGEKKIAVFGEKLVKQGAHVLTHCHSSTVEDILKTAFKKRKFTVFNTETRPLFQGRITAKNLRSAGLNVTMVEDSAAAFLISKNSGKSLMMNMVIIGADSLLPDGSAINKIGSYGISLAAREEKIPLYIACHLLKMDDDGIIPIEIRPENEIWPDKPKGLKIINFAFDKTPAKNITGIICEFGVIKPQQAKKLVAKHYPWIFKK